MSRLVPVHNPHPGGTYIWFTVPDQPESEMERTVTTAPGPQAGTGNEPVPYSLTPAAEAALDDPEARGPYPGSGDPERLAQWCGFPAMAAMEAACDADGRELAATSEAEARWEAGCEALAAEAEDPEAEPW